LAGRGNIEIDSMLAAIKLAIELAHSKASWNTSQKNVSVRTF
jgi:hypothetical protein